MSSKQRRIIARQNGAKAAGTKSPEGIQKSIQNARKHGMTAKILSLSYESEPAFDALLQDYIDRFQPKDSVEMGLVDEMVMARWRQRRTQ